MRNSTRRWVVGFIIVAVLAVGVNAIIGAESSTDVAVRWANGLNPAQELAWFKHIEKLRPEYQSSLVNRMGFATLKAGMIDRLERAKRSSRWPAPEQQGLIQTMIDLWINHPDNEPVSVLLQRSANDGSIIRTQAQEVLGDDFMSLFWFNGGALMNPQGSPDDSPQMAQALPLGVRIKQVFADMQSVLANAPTCNCNKDVSICSNGASHGTCPDAGGCTYVSDLPMCDDPWKGNACAMGCMTGGGVELCNARCQW